MTHTVSTTPVPDAVTIDVTCTCGYHAVTIGRFVDLIVGEHIAHPVAHLDPRLVIGV